VSLKASDLTAGANQVGFDDTVITVNKDDTIDINVAGAVDFEVSSNLFTAKSGSVFKVDEIQESTSGSGVTVDGVLLKDGGVSASSLKVQNAGDVRTILIDDAYYMFKAWDNVSNLKEVARLQSASDPYFSFGGSQEHKFYFSGAYDASARIKMVSDTKIWFRDSAVYINSNDDGHLDITADTSVDINAPLVATTDATFNGDLTVTDGSQYVKLFDSAYIRSERSNYWNTLIEGRVIGDAYSRIKIDIGDGIYFGDGSSAHDVNLYRDSANVLKTDDKLVVGGVLELHDVLDLTNIGAGNPLIKVVATSDTPSSSPETDPEQGWIEIDIGGTSYYIPYYN